MIRLLGPLELLVEGESRPLGSPKQKAVLAILALSSGRVVSTDRLVEELWGDNAPESSVSTLQVYISRIRAAVSWRAEPAGEPALRVLRRPPGYSLETADDVLDTKRFQRLMAGAAERLTENPDWAKRQLDAALALHTGHPLSDLIDQLGPASSAEVHRLSEMILAAQELRLEAMVSLGEAATVAQEAALLSSQHPLRESLRGIHILALYRAGRQVEALESYASIRRDLSDELGVDPTPALRRLHAQVLRHDPALDLVPVRKPVTEVVAEPVPEVAAHPPAASAASPRQFGRDAAMASLRKAVADTAAGAGSAWLIAGEAGIGKTLLSEQVAHMASGAELTVAWGRSHETADRAPFWPWVQLLRSLPELAVDGAVGVLLGSADPTAGLPPTAARIRIYDDVVSQLLELASRKPTLLVLEDLHWADELTLDLLSVLIERSSNTPLLLVCTYRADSAGPETPTGALLARGARYPHVRRLLLTGLDRGDVRRLLAARLAQPPSPELVATAHDRSDGNPFFLIELVRMVKEAGTGDLLTAWTQIPHSVRDVILHRIGRVSQDARVVLEVASVVGRECELDLLSKVSGLNDVALDEALLELVEASLITEHLRPRPGVRFLHALVRETVYDRLRAMTRARLHAAVGEAINPADRLSDLDAIAFHLIEGADVVGAEQVLPILIQAARWAHERLAYEHAERLLERSRALLERVPVGASRDVLDFNVSVLQSTLFAAMLGATAPPTTQALDRALRLSVDAEPNADVVATLYGVASTRTLLGEYTAVVELAGEILDRVVPGPIGERWELLGRWILGVVRWYQGEFSAAVTDLTRALDLAGTHGSALVGPFFTDPVVPIRSLLAFALISAGAGSQGAGMINRQLAEARRSGDPFELGNALLFSSVAATFADDAVGALALAMETETHCVKNGFGFNALLARHFRGWAMACHGVNSLADRRAGVVMLAESLTQYRQAGARSNLTLFLGLLSEARFAAGQSTAAVEALGEALEISQTIGERFWDARLVRQKHRLELP
ncbi:MAG: BTAD domain-containing putative transcriptional regulator [Nakamurella sp.]